MAAMALATQPGAYGAAYLQALLEPPRAQPELITAPAQPIAAQPALLTLADLPRQAEVDRALSSYETYVWIPDRVENQEAAVARRDGVLR